MIHEIMHVGITVSDLDRSIRFYRDVMGLNFVGELVMEGEETDILFGRPGARARVAYLNGSDSVEAPPVELICFTSQEVETERASLFRTSISEICFRVDNLEETYRRLSAAGVECLSRVCDFDFTSSGFGKSRALYFRDPDGVVLELMESR